MRVYEKESPKECYIEFTGTYLENVHFHSTHNGVPHSIITSEYKGEAFTKHLDMGFRDYHAKRLEDKRSTANNIFLIFAVFLATLGVLGLIVEARFYRIDKQS